MSNAVIVSTARTAIGRAGKGSLIDVRPDDMLALVMRAAVDKVGLNTKLIEDVIVGNTMPYNEANPINIARGAAFLAGFPETVGGVTVNRFCSSSLQGIRMAYHAIQAGEGDTFVCGGVESVTRATSGPEPDVAHPRFSGADKKYDLYMTMVS